VGPGGIHTAQRFQRLFRAEARRVADHHLRQADDGVERRAQLVAHAGEELRLALACVRQLPALVLDFASRADARRSTHLCRSSRCRRRASLARSILSVWPIAA
jgi:hypothetical protein